METPLTLAIIGAGQRGKAYARYALSHPEKCKVIAVAEPRPKTRQIMVDTHSISPSMVFESWEDFVRSSADSIAAAITSRSADGNLCGPGRLTDAVLVAVQDSMHAPIVTALAAQGYHILCEKPMATSPEDCIRMTDAVKRSGTIFGIGHVLRYSPYNKDIMKIIQSRQLGDIVNIVHVEPVGYFHFAHSYVRGNWSTEKESSFSLMTKSCHDIDILCNYLSTSASKPVRVSSFGSLSHFRKAHKPMEAGAAKKCLECPIQDVCTYSAKKIYLDPVSRGILSWPASAITDGTPDIESVNDALETGRYGLCVYESPNDVVDHQVVNLEFSSGQTCSFTMVAFTELICERQTRIHFTHGELIGNMETFTTTDFKALTVRPSEQMNDGKATKLHTPVIDQMSGHGGGDIGLIAAFVQAVKEGRQDILGITADDVLASHLTVFAAEQSRLQGRVVDVEMFEAEVRGRMAKA
ncbi:hypothetical protein BS47DRAFT_1353600 [Hydnum rufescens UP504]|uniref:Gfo/Idh/MocA-like oxidoreductase N-terminal domain-containing protein n=1 Tax=Hydnum rufescens UP504 TaxID=1448309 RepID=A0A9P6AHA7_9AGAM|nr:hypothetical protein BS47DRAFT_1353600 [Hydnum rufescens UP504]